MATKSKTVKQPYKTKAALRREKANFSRASRAEHQFAAQLRAVASHIGKLVKGIVETHPLEEAAAQLRDMLNQYSLLLRPWAKSVAQKMLADVARRDELVWAKRGKAMNRALRKEIKQAPIGERVRELMAEQVDLITSLPHSAAERVHKLTMKGIVEGGRYPDIAAEIMKTGLVTQSRANLIARTEVARTASVLTQARAEFVGSEGYIWRTALDAAVRPRHRHLEGKFIRWDDPPIAGENGERAHAGQIYNCRCYAEVVLPETL